MINLFVIDCLIDFTRLKTKSMLYPRKKGGYNMLFLAKLAGIIVLVWFYLTGKKLGEPPVKWAIIGLVGYWLSWWLGNKIILASLVGMFSKSSVIVFVVTQIPVACGVAVAFFVRRKLIKDAGKKESSAEL